jgi:NDP-sugar pyrophosphorylase family protein
LLPLYTKEDARKIFANPMIMKIPVLKNGELIEVLLKEEFLSGEGQANFKKEKIDLPVVIMAGGKGARLDPFTKILPKPLIPIGDKSIIEVIMDNYAEYGMSEFFLSVNHKAKMVKAYFEEFSKNYHISYIEEDQPLGTAGALKLLEHKMRTPFFVSNCDVLIKADYSHVYKYHVEEKCIMTLVASMQHHVMPYGVCEIDAEHSLKRIVEKPEYDFLINTGVYVCDLDVLSFIPKRTLFNMTDLIRVLKEGGKKIGVYPILQNSWMDVGQWEEYRKTLKVIEGS